MCEHGATVKQAGRDDITQMRDGDVFTGTFLSWCAFARQCQIKRTVVEQDESRTFRMLAIEERIAIAPA